MKCSFYNCNDEGKCDAELVNGTGLMVEAKLCEAHDRFTKAGGDMAVLFRRLDRPRPVGYTYPSGANGPQQPPTTGGE